MKIKTSNLFFVLPKENPVLWINTLPESGYSSKEEAEENCPEDSEVLSFKEMIDKLYWAVHYDS